MSKDHHETVEDSSAKHRALPENIGLSSDEDAEKVFNTVLRIVAIVTVAALWAEALLITI